MQRSLFSRIVTESPEDAVIMDAARSSSTITDNRGRVLRFVDSFTRGIIDAGSQTEPHTWETEQEVIFVAAGDGQLHAGGVTWELQAGDAVLLPPGVDHVLGAGEQNLEIYMVRETVAPGGAHAKEPLVRNFSDIKPLVSHWSYLAYPVFGTADGLTAMRDILVVRLDPLQVGDSHGHGPGMDEVWTMWRGAGIHVVGQEVCVQEEGVAVSVCPCEPGHTLINHTQDPIYLFYFCSNDHN
ncbi:MAG: cupin domain-containing protein [Gemmatimonadetes bacterium]|nr:cupin domain-containing protein [Gemmatimonadota bacterium]MBT7863060.1 cupin domain-containing protein [Gemmatimonadota bacterium]